MDRLRRYVCAFTDAVGAPSTTESCKGGVPVAEEAGKPGGIIDVNLPPSAPRSDGPDSDLLDRGIFEVIESRWR
jgi:hypothetical protein